MMAVVACESKRLHDSKRGSENKQRGQVGGYLSNRMGRGRGLLRAGAKRSHPLTPSIALPCSCDFGVMHHAGELVQAFHEFVSGEQFQLPSVPKTHAAYQRELANGTPHKVAINFAVEKLSFDDIPEAQVRWDNARMASAAWLFGRTWAGIPRRGGGEGGPHVDSRRDGASSMIRVRIDCGRRGCKLRRQERPANGPKHSICHR